MSQADGYITITQAAEALGVKPYEVVRLIDAGQIKTVTLVEAASLPEEKA